MQRVHLLSGRNVRLLCCMLPPGESRRVCRRDRQTEGQTDGRQTITLRFSLEAASVRTRDECGTVTFLLTSSEILSTLSIKRTVLVVMQQPPLTCQYRDVYFTLRLNIEKTRTQSHTPRDRQALTCSAARKKKPGGRQLPFAMLHRKMLSGSDGGGVNGTRYQSRNLDRLTQHYRRAHNATPSCNHGGPRPLTPMYCIPLSKQQPRHLSAEVEPLSTLRCHVKGVNLCSV